MIGLQEMTRLAEKEDNKDLGKSVTEMLHRGYFDYDEANLWGTGYIQREQRINPMKTADRQAIFESVKNIPLREFLARSGTAGIAGAAYLIPTKIYQIMFDSAVEEDLTTWLSIGGNIIPAEQIGGTTMSVDIAKDGSYVPKKISSGGIMPTETIETVQATLDFSDIWSLNFRIGNDLIEDSQFDIIEMHVRNAGREMGEFATNEALTVLKTATDGDGTVNGGATTDVNQTMFTGATGVDLKDAHQEVLDDGYFPNKMVLVPHAWYHSIVTTGFIAASTYSEPWAYEAIVNGLPTKMLGCEIRWTTVNTMTNDKVMDDLVSIMFEDRFALLSGRKRWLRIENYSEPIRDLVGAAITCRQDSVTVYNDSIGVVTET